MAQIVSGARERLPFAVAFIICGNAWQQITPTTQSRQNGFSVDAIAELGGLAIAFLKDIPRDAVTRGLECRRWIPGAEQPDPKALAAGLCRFEREPLAGAFRPFFSRPQSEREGLDHRTLEVR